MELNITQIESDLLLSNMYIVECDGRFILIDPCISDIEINCSCVDYILLTHEHYDHISGVNHWKERTNATVLCSKNCAKNISNPSKNLSKYFRQFCELQSWIGVSEEYFDKFPSGDLEYQCEANEVFEGIKDFSWQGHEIKLIEIPGHSLGSTCILIDDEICFSGDSLLKDFPTECGLPGGSKKKWLNLGLPIMKSLPQNLVVYPGHLESFNLSDYQYWPD